MSIESVDEEKKKLVIQRRKEGVTIRKIAKETHLSFSTIGKIWREREGQKESKPEKSITSKAFQLFEKRMNLVEVTIKLDLNPAEAEKIYQDYLRHKGLVEIVRYIQMMKKHLSSFIDFVNACEQHTPESQKLVEILNLQKVIQGMWSEKVRVSLICQDEERRLDDLKQKAKEIEQRIQNLNLEEYNKWYELFGNGKYYSNNQYTEQ